MHTVYRVSKALKLQCLHLSVSLRNKTKASSYREPTEGGLHCLPTKVCTNTRMFTPFKRLRTNADNSHIDEDEMGKRSKHLSHHSAKNVARLIHKSFHYIYHLVLRSLKRFSGYVTACNYCKEALISMLVGVWTVELRTRGIPPILIISCCPKNR